MDNDHFFYLILLLPPKSTLFPYTTLFRSAVIPTPSQSLRIGLLRRRHRLRTDQALHHRSEEHTSELQSLTNLVCRLLLEKKNLKIVLGARPTPYFDSHAEPN